MASRATALDIFAVRDSFAQAGLHGGDRPAAARHHPAVQPADPSTIFYATGANPLYAGLGLPASGSIERTFDLDVRTTQRRPGRRTA